MWCTLQNKLRVVYLPFMLSALGCVVGYSFLNWLLLIKTEVFALDEEVVNIWLPMAIPWLPILLWLRPRLKALQQVKLGRSDLRNLFYFLSWMAIAAPTIISQFYLATATGEITNLARISKIGQVPRTKYYAVQDVFIDKANTSSEISVHLSGKYNQYLDMAAFLVCPLDDSGYFQTQTCKVWLGTVYKKQISSRLADSEREAQLSAFLQASSADYNRSDLRMFTYLERAGINDDGRGLGAAVRRNSRYRAEGTNTVLMAHHDNFNARNGNKLAWVFGSFGIGAGVWLLILMCAPVDHAEMKRLLAGGKTNNDGLVDAFGLFLPNRRLFVTPILIDLNVLVFIGMVFAGMGVVSFNRSDLLALGANFRPAVLDGEIWRLITSMFIHGGLMHIAGNIFGLWLVGMLLEPGLGRTRFAVCYFVCGVGGSIASVVWHPATVSIGASGAIVGLWGVLLGLSILQRKKGSFRKNDLIKFVLFILGYNLLFGLIVGGIDNAAHLGGLICGILIAALDTIFPGLLGHGRDSNAGKRDGHNKRIQGHHSTSTVKF
jgi:rhomboid protease GluP